MSISFPTLLLHLKPLNNFVSDNYFHLLVYLDIFWVDSTHLRQSVIFDWVVNFLCIRTTQDYSLRERFVNQNHQESKCAFYFGCFEGKLERTAILKAVCAGFKESTEPRICLSGGLYSEVSLTNISYPNFNSWSNRQILTTFFFVYRPWD